MSDHYVYVLRDVDGECLYVGCSGNPLRRLQAHRRGPWGSAITEATVYPIESQAEALERETQLIRELKPPNNSDKNPAVQGASYGKRKDQVIAALREHGRMTARECAESLTSQGIDGTRSFVSPTLERLCGLGIAHKVGTVPAISGRWKTATVYDLAPSCR